MSTSIFTSNWKQQNLQFGCVNYELEVEGLPYKIGICVCNEPTSKHVGKPLSFFDNAQYEFQFYLFTGEYGSINMEYKSEDILDKFITAEISSTAIVRSLCHMRWISGIKNKDVEILISRLMEDNNITINAIETGPCTICKCIDPFNFPSKNHNNEIRCYLHC